jgi:hypothetical protein
VLYFVLSLCVAQAVADFGATLRWKRYVADFRSRLASQSGLIEWESTLNTSDKSRDVDWELFKFGWVIPDLSIALAPNSSVKTIIDYPKETTFRPFDPSRTDQLPHLRGIDFSPYELILNTK